MKYFLVSLGCQMNKSDTERITTVLESLGYSPASKEEEAQILGVVACSVRQKAIDKAFSKIAKWNKRKNREHLITFISGCVLPNDRTKFLKKFDLVFSMAELPNLGQMLSTYGVVSPLASRPELVEEAKRTALESIEQARLAMVRDEPARPKAISASSRASIDNREKLSSFWHIKPSYSSSFEAYVPIQNGCDKFCTFCAVPYTRGREVSRPSAEVLQEVRDLVDRGYKSITLLGQNVNSYGLDTKGADLSFPQLMEEIGKMGDESGKDFWVYFTSPHPRDMTSDLLEVMSRYQVLANWLHLPLQSGDDKILVKMNRNHTLARYREVVSNIREILPEATLFTDIIVGFTTETETAFEETLKAMKEFKYNMAYIAMYSPRPGAASSRWEDDVPLEEKKRRLHVLTEELQRYNSEYNASLIGTRHRVLVDGTDRKDGYLSAKTEGKLILRFPSSDKTLIGTFQDIIIESASPLSLEGSLVTESVGVQG
jgi:tRNA-2-methylthio-N6-dimethylallyladenosine synthase